MKKTYQKPELWVSENVLLNLMSPSFGQWADGKENTGTNPTIDDEEDHLNAKFNWSVWGDDEEEEDN